MFPLLGQLCVLILLVAALLPTKQHGAALAADEVDEPGLVAAQALALEDEAVDAALEADLVEREGLVAEAEQTLAVAGAGRGGGDEVAEEQAADAAAEVVVGGAVGVWRRWRSEEPKRPKGVRSQFGWGWNIVFSGLLLVGRPPPLDRPRLLAAIVPLPMSRCRVRPAERWLARGGDVTGEQVLMNAGRSWAGNVPD